MSIQLALPFDEVPVTCSVQERYHAIVPCLAGKITPVEQARNLNTAYSTIMRWLQPFRQQGMPGLFDATSYPREPYTPERVIVLLIYFKCCVPKASDRELSRVIHSVLGHKLHNETVRDLLNRYFFWRYREFTDRIQYPTPADPQPRRLESVHLSQQGWSEQSIAVLLCCSSRTVRRWRRRWAYEQAQGLEASKCLFDRWHGPHQPHRKVYFGTIHAVLVLQKKYGYAGWFRIQGYLEKDYGIRLKSTTLKKIMRLNRQLHLAPVRPIVVEVREAREGPPHSEHPFQYLFIDFRYLDAKPGGAQLYSCLLLEGYSRTILAGSLTRRQDVGVVLAVYYAALLAFGVWEETISDHGKQFQSHAFQGVHRRLQIRHTMYEKGHPWQSLIESQFGIQARLGEYAWERCATVDEAVEVHRQLMQDMNRLPHFAHRYRGDNKHAPLEVLGEARGREVDAATLHEAFSRKTWKRRTDPHGFVRINRWKIYVEAGLPKTPIQVNYWDGKLRAEYQAQVLAEYRCRWDATGQRPKAITQPRYYETPFQSRQRVLFDPLWVRDPIEGEPVQKQPKQVALGGQQLRFRFGPELVKG